MRILFIGIFDNNEPNTAFRNALKQASKGEYIEIPWNQYRSKSELQNIIVHTAITFRPELVFMQLQGPNIISDKSLEALKYSRAFICQWTGDARQPLPKHYIEFGRKINLSLFTNMNDVEVMREQGVPADYLQVSADNNIYTNEGSRSQKVPEIVFMGNNYGNAFALSGYRLDMCNFLKNIYKDRFAVYGHGYGRYLTASNLMFNQQKEAEVYRSCKIAINCSHYDLKKYTSDRFFRILMSGAFCLTREFPDMDEYGPGTHFDYFDNNFTNLKNKIDYYLHCEEERKQIAHLGNYYAHENWTWQHRINELLKLVEKWNG